jgi:hypothetical protein
MPAMVPLALVGMVAVGCTPSGEPLDSAAESANSSHSSPPDGESTAEPADTGETGDSSVDPCEEAQLLWHGPTDGDTLFTGTRYLWSVWAENHGGGAEYAIAAGSGDSGCDSSQYWTPTCWWVPEAEGETTVRLSADPYGCPVDATLSVKVREPVGIYPAGDRFPVAMYEATVEDLGLLASHGVNLVQSYDSTADGSWQAWAAAAAAEGLSVVGPVASEEEFAALAGDATLAEAIAWWSLPEEQRYWYPDEMATVTTLADAIHAADSRPVFMYIPGNYAASDIANYVPWLDLIGAGAYAEYSGQPHVWVRWRAESEIEAIESMGHDLDERTPLGLPGAFVSELGTPTEEEAIHDVFASIVGGARGIFPFAWYHAVYDEGSTADEGLLWAAERLGGVDGVGEWILHGEEVELDWSASGETEITLNPEGVGEETVPAQAVRAWSRYGTVVIVAVNSSESPVRIGLSGLPGVDGEFLGSDEEWHGSDGNHEGRGTVELDGLGVALLQVTTKVSPWDTD